MPPAASADSVTVSPRGDGHHRRQPRVQKTAKTIVAGREGDLVMLRHAGALGVCMTPSKTARADSATGLTQLSAGSKPCDCRSVRNASGLGCRRWSLDFATCFALAAGGMVLLPLAGAQAGAQPANAFFVGPSSPRDPRLDGAGATGNQKPLRHSGGARVSRPHPEERCSHRQFSTMPATSRALRHHTIVDYHPATQAVSVFATIPKTLPGLPRRRRPQHGHDHAEERLGHRRQLRRAPTAPPIPVATAVSSCSTARAASPAPSPVRTSTCRGAIWRPRTMAARAPPCS